MRTPNHPAAAAATVALLLLTACSSSTAGSGTHPRGASGPASAGPTSAAPTTDSQVPPSTAGTTVTLTAPAGTSAAPAPSSRPAPGASSVGGTSASATTPSAFPVPSAPVTTARVAAPGGGTGYVIKIWAADDVRDCAAHAYGAAVVSYLRTHGCKQVRRLLATTTVNGRAVGFAQSDLNFVGTTTDKSYAAAGGFRSLVTRDGTGNVQDLLHDGYRLPSGPTQVPTPDAFSALAQDNGVTVVDAWYLQGPTPDNDPALVKMAQDIYLQF